MERASENAAAITAPEQRDWKQQEVSEGRTEEAQCEMPHLGLKLVGFL